jgi:hypothetical protein
MVAAAAAVDTGAVNHVPGRLLQQLTGAVAAARCAGLAGLCHAPGPAVQQLIQHVLLTIWVHQACVTLDQLFGKVGGN